MWLLAFYSISKQGSFCVNASMIVLVVVIHLNVVRYGTVLCVDAGVLCVLCVEICFVCEKADGFVSCGCRSCCV